MFTSPLTAHHRQAMQQQNQHQHQYQSSSYQNNYQSSYGVATASPQSIFGGSAPSPASSTSSSPTNFTMPVNLPVMEGWPPGAFHRFRWCYVNEGNFCKADPTQATMTTDGPAVKSCAWCRIPMP